jgi:6-pyruvoyl-tetrahydropterin synthase
MKQIDAGANDPDMHVAVSTHNKEIRESSMKMSELLSKMKAFYKELRDEYEHKEINEQQKLEDTKNPQEQIEAKPNDLVIFDQRKWNKIIDEFKKDPTLLDGKAFGTAGT